MATSRPLVTIGLPVHNGADFVDQAITSVLAQTCTNFELLIADNGSTDDTVRICAAYSRRDSRIVLYRSPRNRGAAWNYSRLVGLAQGKYFKWAAHDDVLQPDFLSAGTTQLEQSPQAALWHTWAIDIDDQGRTIGSHRPAAYAGQSHAGQRIRDVLQSGPRAFETFGLIRHNCLLRTDRIAPYPGSNRVLLTQLAALGSFIVFPQELFLHREHPGRSEHVHRSLRDRSAWFSPDAGPTTHPHLTVLHRQLQSIGRAPISPAHKAVALTGLPTASLRELNLWYSST